MPKPGEPGDDSWGNVWVRHSSLPVRASLATMTQASGPAFWAQLRPEMTLSPAMIGPPEVEADWVFQSVTWVSHTCLPVWMSTA